MFEPQSGTQTKQWKQCIAKRTISTKKMLQAIYLHWCHLSMGTWCSYKSFVSKKANQALIEGSVRAKDALGSV